MQQGMFSSWLSPGGLRNCACGSEEGAKTMGLGLRNIAHALAVSAFSPAFSATSLSSAKGTSTESDAISSAFRFSPPVASMVYAGVRSERRMSQHEPRALDFQSN